VQAIRFDSKGRFLLAGCEDGEVRQFSLADPSAPSKLLGKHPGGVLAITSLASNRLLTAGGDGNVMVWDLDKGIPRGKILFQVGPVRTVSIDRNRNLLLAGGQGLALRDGQANTTPILEPRIPVRAARFILAGTAAVAGGDDRQIRLIDTTHCVVVEERPLDSAVTTMEPIPQTGSPWVGFADGTVRRLDPFSLQSH